MRLKDIVLGMLGFGRRAEPPASAPAPEPAPAAAPTPAPDPVVGTAKMVRAVFDLQNNTRGSYDLPPLRWDPRAAAAAHRHIAECVGRGRLVCTGIGGSTVGDRLRGAGLSWVAAGENLALGPPTPSAVVRAWFASPDHRANMLGEAFTAVGVGAAVDAHGRVWWCVTFARPRQPRGAAVVVEEPGEPSCPRPLIEKVA